MNYPELVSNEDKLDMIVNYIVSQGAADLLLLVAAFIVLAFSVRLWFKKAGRDTNRLLSLILTVTALWLISTVCIDFQLGNYFPRWSWVALQLLLSVSPLLLFYVRSIARPSQKFTRKAPSPSSKDKLIQRGYWLRHQMKVNRFYLDAELSLNSLAKELGISIHELSRIINTGLRKNFNDFVNEFRIHDVARKMRNPSYDRMTFLGIAYDCGFNSKTTFNRAFRQITGKSPAEYKAELKKERPNHDLGRCLQFAAIISFPEATSKWTHEKINRNVMFRNYLKTAWRNLIKNKISALINIGGLAVGMAVAMLISLWIWDELSFDKYYKNYDRIARVVQNVTSSGEVKTWKRIPYPLGDELRKSYGNDFKYVVMGSFSEDHILTAGEKKIVKTGVFFEPQIIDLLGLKMISGTKTGLNDPSSILLSESVAKAYFGDADPINKSMKIDTNEIVKVAGVYEDIPYNSTFNDVGYMGTWEMYKRINNFPNILSPWRSNGYMVYVQMADNADMNIVSQKIKNIRKNKIANTAWAHQKPALFLEPMSKWHLYSEYKNGVSVGGRIQYVWLFGIIGIFILLLACINFMNLSTARSEKRAKEVGIRKAIGSLRGQLIGQFLCESLLVSTFAFAISIILAQIALSFFNQVADKRMSILWGSPLFWLLSLSFSLIIGIIAGSYPAFYLSSFGVVKVLKGTFKVGRHAAIPRKILVVLQFTVSIILIIGTIVVFRQIQFAKNRPIGYSRDGLVSIPLITEGIHKNFDAFKDDLMKTGAISGVAEVGNPPNSPGVSSSGFDWPGKDQGTAVDFLLNVITPDYGNTVGWQFKEGRNFSKEFLTDSMAYILNESAVKYMGLKNPVGTIIKRDGKPYKIIGVVNDMISESPYDQIRPTVFSLFSGSGNYLIARIDPKMSAREALGKVEKVFNTYNPSQPFDYRFVDDEYAKKFGNEERIGKLASFFASLAIFISCLGLFGMATFMAEQRIKEIGVRKVLGATVVGLWGLLIKDFVKLVFISLLIAIPVAYYFMHDWVQHYSYHTEISWWIFVATAAGAVLITLTTVSFQIIKAAFTSPAKSLKTE